MAEVGTLIPCTADTTINTIPPTSVLGDALETHIANGDSASVTWASNENGVGVSETGAWLPTEDPPALTLSRRAAAPEPA